MAQCGFSFVAPCSDAAVVDSFKTCCKGGLGGGEDAVMQNGTALQSFIQSDAITRSCIHTLTPAKGLDSSDHSSASGPDSYLDPTFVLFSRHLKARSLHRTSHPPPVCLFCCHTLTKRLTDS